MGANHSVLIDEKPGAEEAVCSVMKVSYIHHQMNHIRRIDWELWKNTHAQTLDNKMALQL